MRAAMRLRVVRDDGEPGAGARQVAGPSPDAPERGDLALLAFLFLLNLLPVAGELAGIGRWSPSIVGFATGALLLTGRELWAQLRLRRRPRTTPRSDEP